MAADADNRAVLFQMAKQWDKMDTLSRLADIVPHEQPRKSWSSRLPLNQWLAVAASFVVVTVLAALWLIESPPSAVVAVTGPVVSDNMERYETALGERSRLDLADGSVALLNTQGRLRVRYTPHERSLFLDGGEIHVEVAHDANRPFTVYVGSRIVQAVGTAFSIKLESPSTIEVVVTDGRVKVGDDAHGAATQGA